MTIAAMPKGKRHFQNWGAVQIKGAKRILVIGDLHIPWHDEEAVALALKYGKDRDADTILINGDMVDFYAISRWETDPKKRDLAGEVDAGIEFLKHIREMFPKAKIVWKEGNHEERWEAYLRKKASELLGLKRFTWQAVYELEEHGIEHVGDCRPAKLGKLHIIHGHEYRFAIQNPVNPARGLFNRGKVHAVTNHFHQFSSHSERRLDQKVITTWSIGCLCDLHPEYAVLNNWQHGFAFVEVSASGAFEVTNTRIIEGKVYT